MDTHAIKQAAVCRWSADDDCFVIDSPKCSQLIACGETEAEAWEVYDAMLADAYSDYTKGLFSPQRRMGRPAQHRKRVTVTLADATLKRLGEIEANKGYTRGEAIDYLVSQATA